MKVLSLLVNEGILCLSFAVAAMDISPHDKLLCENYDISEAKESWDDSQWWMDCLFVDVNNDGYNEIILSTVSQADRSGSAWYFWTTKPDGRMHRIRKDRLLARKFRFYCYDDSYYWLSLGDGVPRVIGLDMRAGIQDDDRILRNITSPDCVFGIDNEGQLIVTNISPCLDKVFYEGGLAQVGRLFSEHYSGFNFKFEPCSRSVDWWGYKHPKPVAIPEAPAGFDAFVADYRKAAQIRAGTTNNVPVFAVFLDADNDGLSDFYIASDVDCEEDEVYHWTLYMNEDGHFKRVANPVHPVKGRDDLPTLPREAVARKDAFCRVIRFNAPPTHIILNDATVAECLVKRTITYRFTHSIAKLPCREY